MLVDNDIGASRWSKGDNRPAYRRLPDVLKPGDVLVYWEPSRTGRDLRAYVDLRDLCAERGVFWCVSGRFVDPSKGDDRFQSGLEALLAEKEAEQIRERVLRAQRANAEQGKAHGRIPYGYAAVRDPHSGRVIDRVPHPQQAIVFKEIVKRFMRGESMYSIAKDLNHRGEPTVTGAPWTPQNIGLMMKRPTYAGFRTWKGEITGKGQWEPLIDEETHRKIVAILSDPSRKMHRGVEPKHLLTGIATCGVCGSPAHVLNSGGYPAYACSANSRCTSRTYELCNAVVTEIVLGRLSDPNLFAPIDEKDTDRLQALDEIAELRSRWEALSDEYAEGNITAAMLAKLEKKLQDRIDDAERRAKPKITDPLLERFAGPSAREVWEAPSTTVLQRRDVIRALCESIVIKPVGKNRRAHMDPESILVKLR